MQRAGRLCGKTAPLWSERSGEGGRTLWVAARLLALRRFPSTSWMFVAHPWSMLAVTTTSFSTAVSRRCRDQGWARCAAFRACIAFTIASSSAFTVACERDFRYYVLALLQCRTATLFSTTRHVVVVRRALRAARPFARASRARSSASTVARCRDVRALLLERL